MFFNSRSSKDIYLKNNQTLIVFQMNIRGLRALKLSKPLLLLPLLFH